MRVCSASTVHAGSAACATGLGLGRHRRVLDRCLAQPGFIHPLAFAVARDLDLGSIELQQLGVHRALRHVDAGVFHGQALPGRQRCLVLAQAQVLHGQLRHHGEQTALVPGQTGRAFGTGAQQGCRNCDT
jgi:hypothetical protein